MQILVISHKYPPSIGGMQTHCFKLVQELKRNHVIHELIWKYNYPRILFFLTVIPRALWILRKNPSIDIIYVNDGLMALVCTPLLWLTKTPITVTIHGLDINFPSRFYQKWARKYLNRFDKIIAVSVPTSKLCEEKGLDPTKIVTVKNAVDIHIMPTAENPLFRREFAKVTGIDLNGKIILTSLGRAIPRKGFDWFTRNVMPILPDDYVYVILARKFPQARLFKILKMLTSKKLYEKIRLLVGAEIDDWAIDQSIRELSLEQRVFHLSNFSHSRDKIFEIIKHSDLFIMPNIKIPGDYEGFGLVALEAASQGTLVLAGNVDGIPSAVKDGENGYLIEQGNAESWKLKILELTEDSSRLQVITDKFQKSTLSQGRSWEEMAREYINVFKGLAK